MVSIGHSASAVVEMIVETLGKAGRRCPKNEQQMMQEYCDIGK